jgi:hypothetical protein
MIRRHETDDSKGYIQGQDRKLRGVFRTICAGDSGELLLLSRDRPPHGRSKTTSRTIVYYWAEGYVHNWNSGFTHSISNYLYFFSRYQDSGCTGGYDKNSSHQQMHERMTVPTEETGGSKHQVYNNVQGALVRFGQLILPPQYLAVSSRCHKSGCTGGHAQN